MPPSKRYLTIEKALEGAVPPEGELVWNYVGMIDYENLEFELVQISPAQWALRPIPGEKGKSLLAIFSDCAESWQKKLVKDYRRGARAIAKQSILLIDSDHHRVVDGQHRMIAMALEGVTKVWALDLSRPRK